MQKKAFWLVVTLLKHVWQWKKDGWALMHDGKVKKRGSELQYNDCTDSPSCSSGARIRVRSQTLVAKKHSALALKHSEGGLVSPATWWKPPVDFFYCWLEGRACIQSLPLLLLYDICAKSGFDRLMRVLGVFFSFLHALWVWSCFGLKPDWQMYGKLLDSKGHFVSFADFLFFFF